MGGDNRSVEGGAKGLSGKVAEKMKNIVILISGTGSNMAAIVRTARRDGGLGSADTDLMLSSMRATASEARR